MPAIGPPTILVNVFRPVYRHMVPGLSSMLDVAGARITSLFRDPQDNARVGGHPRSQHLFGFAADLAGADLGRMTEIARAEGLVAVREGDHVHVQVFTAGVIPEWVFDLVWGPDLDQ